MRLVVPLEMADMKGGMLQSVELLLRFLPSTIEKIVFIPASSAVGGRMSNAGARVVYSRQNAWQLARSSPWASLKSFFLFRRELKSLLTPGTILLTNNIAVEILCGFAARKSRARRVFVNRGNEYRGVSAMALRRSLQTCSFCVATTTYQRKTLIEALGVDAARIRVIPNGVNIDELSAAQSAPKPDWYLPSRIHIATIGYPSEGKNQSLLIESIALLRDTHPEVVGVVIGSAGSEGDRIYEKFLRRLVRERRLEDRILFVPFMESKASMFAGIDILASTSLREGFGRTIIEAMAAGKPVVALKAGGPETIIADGITGLLVPTNSPIAFTEALIKLANNSALRRTLVAAATIRCRSVYACDAIALSYEALFREVLNDGSQARASLTEQRR